MNESQWFYRTCLATPGLLLHLGLEVPATLINGWILLVGTVELHWEESARSLQSRHVYLNQSLGFEIELLVLKKYFTLKLPKKNYLF